MPARSQAQHAFMLADLQRARRGEPTHTGMTLDQLEDYASTPDVESLPKHVGDGQPKKPRPLSPRTRGRFRF